MKPTEFVPVVEKTTGASLKENLKTWYPKCKSDNRTMASIVSELCQEKAQMEDYEPFYVVDASRIEQQYSQWRNGLPRVHPFYAMKCNNHEVMLRSILSLGGGFDCASLEEIKTVQKLLESFVFEEGEKGAVEEKQKAIRSWLGENVIYANPCKPPSHIKYAQEQGVHLTTFDSEEELYKLKKLWPAAQLVLRIIVDDSNSICQFSSKFGCPMVNVEHLVSLCRDLGLQLVGVSFHVGSGCLNASSFVSAVTDARHVFDLAKEKYGFELSLLDIGGGFPGNSDAGISFPEIAKGIGGLLDQLFPEESGVRLIGEPGRYFAAGVFHLACNIFSKKKRATVKVEEEATEEEFVYYINDGVYQSFNCLYFDHHKVSSANMLPIRINSKKTAANAERLHHPGYLSVVDGDVVQSTLVSSDEDEREKYFKTCIFGPTCDSMDKVCDNVQLPQMNVGDWLYFPEFGAYTLSASSSFNGFGTQNFHYVWRDISSASFDRRSFMERIME